MNRRTIDDANRQSEVSMDSRIDELTIEIDRLNGQLIDSQSELSMTRLSKDELTRVHQSEKAELTGEIDRLNDELTTAQIDNASLRATVNAGVNPPVNGQSKLTGVDERRKLLNGMISDGDVQTIQDLMDRLGVSRNTIKRDMAAAGWHLNGNGFERL
jgi:chromosome segregation ATPase